MEEVEVCPDNMGLGSLEYWQTQEVTSHMATRDSVLAACPSTCSPILPLAWAMATCFRHHEGHLQTNV